MSNGKLRTVLGVPLLREDEPIGVINAFSPTSRTVQRASALGATEFLTKPVDFDALKAQLRQLPSAAD